MLDALTHLATAAENAGDDDAALQAAQRQLTLEPSGSRPLLCHARVGRRGQRAAALAQYNRCRQVLAEEFGGEPDGETTALVAQIERGVFDKATKRQGEGVTG